MPVRILIVDDSRTTLAVIKVHLMSRSYEFVTANNATEALSIAQKQAPDLIISDLAMPDVSGIELCKQIRMSLGLRKTPFILVTAQKEDAIRREAFSAGVDGFLRKPIDSAQLQELVTRLLNRRRNAATPQ